MNLSFKKGKVGGNIKKQKQSPGSSVKKVFLKISQNLKENTSARVSFLIKLQVLACAYTNQYIFNQNIRRNKRFAILESQFRAFWTKTNSGFYTKYYEWYSGWTCPELFL